MFDSLISIAGSTICIVGVVLLVRDNIKLRSKVWEYGVYKKADEELRDALVNNVLCPACRKGMYDMLVKKSDEMKKVDGDKVVSMRDHRKS